MYPIGTKPLVYRDMSLNTDFLQSTSQNLDMTLYVSRDPVSNSGKNNKLQSAGQNGPL